MLMSVKNRLILILSSIVLLCSGLVHFLHHSLNLFQHMEVSNVERSGLVTNAFLIFPMILFIVTMVLYRINKEHPLIPLFNTLTITFSSISMIAGGDGMVEYHFSIFMVVAIIGYYESIKLTLIMTVIFAIHHIAGYFLFSQYVFGNMQYSFSMVLIHALFLLGTSGAIIWQTIQKQKLLDVLDEKEQSQQIVSGIIRKLSSTTEKLINASSQLKSNYESNQVAIKEIFAHIQEVSSGASIQKKQTIDSAQIIEEVALNIQQITETSTVVSKASLTTSQEAEHGDAMIQKTVKQMSSINDTVNTSSETVKLLDNRSREIQEIVGLITNIASQTNLLALNAAIEAARAGEHGRGFAVVADEVRQLAEESAISASRIAGIIQTIQQETNSSMKSMDQVISEVKAGLELVQETGEIFERIHTSIDEVADQIKRISHSTEGVSAGAQEALASIQEMASFAEQASTNAQNIATSSEQQLTSVENLSTLISTLNEITYELQDLIEKTKELKL